MNRVFWGDVIFGGIVVGGLLLSAYYIATVGDNPRKKDIEDPLEQKLKLERDHAIRVR